MLRGWPYVVVEDTPSLLALWMPVGARMKRVDLADRNNPLKDLIHGAHPLDEFRRGGCLRLMLPGMPYSIWLHWSRTSPRRFTGWYVNLEAPFVRTDIGVDTTDNSLDLVVMPTLRGAGRMPRWLRNGLRSGFLRRPRRTSSLQTVKMSSVWRSNGVFLSMAPLQIGLLIQNGISQQSIPSGPVCLGTI